MVASTCSLGVSSDVQEARPYCKPSSGEPGAACPWKAAMREEAAHQAPSAISHCIGVVRVLVLSGEL